MASATRTNRLFPVTALLSTLALGACSIDSAAGPDLSTSLEPSLRFTPTAGQALLPNNPAGQGVRFVRSGEGFAMPDSLSGEPGGVRTGIGIFFNAADSTQNAKNDPPAGGGNGNDI